MPAAVEKDNVLVSLIDWLRERLGPSAFLVSNHYADEPGIAALAHPLDSTRLVYFAWFEDGWHVELLTPEQPGNWCSVRTTIHAGLDDEQLAVIVAEHLR